MSRFQILSLAGALGAALSLAACGGPQEMTAQGTAIAPGATAEISVGKTEGTQTVDLDVQHLAPPERLGAGLSQYAVWVVPQGQQPILAGTLHYDPGSQRGQLRATTPYQVFEVLVTAEGDSIGQLPSRTIVLHRGVTAP
ncbi:MAG: hypothetical protein M3Y87_18920 [Myxococcota bacterium]|nr:hypothetical protein [Myxococcota bacterium]